MNFKKVFVAGITASTLMLGGLLPTNGNPNQVEASTIATPYPTSLQAPYEWQKVQEYGLEMEKGAYKIDLGNRTGTLIIKMYFDELYPEGKANTLYTDTRNKNNGGYMLTSKNSGLSNDWDTLAMFNRYTQYPKLQDYKYLSGFSDAGVNAKGEKFIALGVYLNKVLNDGVYYLKMPQGMNKGFWKVKAYFYDKVNVEERVFNEVDRYFPLLGKVWWDGIELKVGQIGRLNVLKDTPLYKLDGDKKVYSRTLKAGEFYRIYAFKPGMLSVGGGYFVDRDSKVMYETPSKSKLQLVQMRVE